jgi:SAM-dependent methyltransferase
LSRELVLGAGRDPRKLITTSGPAFIDPVMLDQFDYPGIDVVHDLDKHPLPFVDEEFDEIHAYEVLEHLSRQGDWRFFFAEWSEYWRILKPGGKFYGSVPALDSPWLWGDPSHTRALSIESFTFLDQGEYARQAGVTAMTDFRSVYRADFSVESAGFKDQRLFFILAAVKPSRFEG